MRREGRGFGRDRDRDSDRDRGGYRPRGNFESDRPKPVKVGEEYDVEITDTGTKGDGITKVENFIVFVHNGKKGEQCRIRIKEVASRFAIGEKVGDSAASDEGSEESEGESEESDKASDED